MSSSDFFTFENSKPKLTASRKDYEKSEFAVARLEKELTSIQRNKTKVINSLAELRSYKNGNNDEWLDEFFSAINEVNNEPKE